MKSGRQDEHQKSLLLRPQVGMAARVVQQCDLRFSRIVIDHPALILLRHGTKILSSAAGEWTIRAGQAVVLAGGQVLDVTNRLSERGRYEASWLVWDPAILARFQRTRPSGGAMTGVAGLGTVGAFFAAAFDHAVEAIREREGIPDCVAEYRLAELLVWLSSRGVHLSAVGNAALSVRVRRLLEGAPARRWTAQEVAAHFSMSEPTFRRRLAGEGTSLTAIMQDLRMSFAMLLLQSTDQPVNRIALDVGYESASRFAIRFRERFGFAPTAIRGHSRISQ